MMCKTERNGIWQWQGNGQLYKADCHYLINHGLPSSLLPFSFPTKILCALFFFYDGVSLGLCSTVTANRPTVHPQIIIHV
jgi:hypothetical protein